MNVVCLFSAAMPNEVQMAYGDGAGSVQLVTAARLLRERADELLGLDADEERPVGRGETGDVHPFKDVAAGDVCVLVRWPSPDAEPEVDYLIARAATPDHLICCAVALDEYVRFGVWNHRMQQQVQQMQVAQAQQQVNDRAAAAIVRAAHLPPNLREMGQA